MPLDLPRASHPLTEAHRVLIGLLAEAYVDELTEMQSREERSETTIRGCLRPIKTPRDRVTDRRGKTEGANGNEKPTRTTFDRQGGRPVRTLCDPPAAHDRSL